MNRKSVNLRKAIIVAMFSALSYIIFFLEFPVFASFEMLKLDFSDIPAFFAAIWLGPISGVLVELFKNVLQLFSKGLGTQMGFGNIMNFLVGCSYIFPFAVTYRILIKKEKIKKNIVLLISSLIGTVFILTFGLAGNYVFTPLFFKYFLSQTVPMSFIMTFIKYATMLNLIKAGMFSALSYPLTNLVKPFNKNIFK